MVKGGLCFGEVWTEGQGDSYISPTLCLRGYSNHYALPYLYKSCTFCHTETAITSYYTLYMTLTASQSTTTMLT